jgi:glucose/arabinose dehydrogenase
LSLLFLKFIETSKKTKFNYIMKRSNLSLSLLTVLAGLLLGFTDPIDKVTKKENKQVVPTLKLQAVAEGLRSPMALAFPDDGTGRTFIADQHGVISIMDKKGIVSATPFLDLSSKIVINQGYDERGLLNVVLHPQFKSNGKFYVYYSARLMAPVQGVNNKSILSEFKVSATNPNIADTTSEKVLFSLDDPESNHNGGAMAFGPDGYFYISIGDGGGAGDRHGPTGFGQNLNVFFGKILRIDVNKGSPYAIPADNPFVGRADVRPEIWAYGLRNVWRFSFDKVSKQLFAGEVGQNLYEEVDIIEKGGNYGWRTMEANYCFNPANGCDMTGLKLPIHEYHHSVGISITGGYIYNGKALSSEYKGRYIFGDYNVGRMFYIEKSGDKWNNQDITLVNKPAGAFRLLSFAEDLAGEIYVLAKTNDGISQTKGIVYKLVKP